MPKILIIDDDPDINESMQITFKSKGFDVISAKEGNEGLSLASKEKPNIIILDVMMPGIDGFKVARTLKKNNDTKDIPILMLTAVKDKLGLDFKDEERDESWNPVDDFCEKPLDHETLAQKINKLLNR